MRVVAGRWRGRRLQAPRGEAVRPTSDRVKEALFSIIGTRVTGAEVADLCCGAGGLGIEALSRGAALVHFVDSSPRSLAATAANLRLCGADEAEARLVRAEARSWLGRRLATDRPPRIVLCDPPYAADVTAGIWKILTGSAGSGGIELAVLEHAGELELPVPDGLPGEVTRRRYGETALTVWEI